MELWLSQAENARQKLNKKILLSIFVEALLIFATFGIGVCEILHMLTGMQISWLYLAGAAGSILLCLFLEKWHRFGIQAGAVFFILYVGVLLIFHATIQNGMLGVWNQVADMFGSKAGIYLTRYAVSENGMAADQVYFLTLMGIAAGVIGYAVTRLRLSILLLLYSMVPPVLISLLDQNPDGRMTVLFYTGIFLLINWISSSNRNIQQEKHAPAFAAGALFLCIVAAVSGGSFQLLVPETGYETSELVTNAREEFRDKIETFRFQKGKINTLPEGRLKETGEWTASDETALTVKMEVPDSLYLRGFVGSVYDGDRWKTISTEDAWKEKTLFYWLHQDGFYGETQLSEVRNMIQDDTLSSETGTMQITNNHADSRYLYTPYEMTELPEGYTGETALTDSTLASGGLFGNRKYSLQTMGNLVKDFTTLGAESYQMLAEGGQMGYRETESYYNAFVYEQDTVLPDSLTSLFQKELGNGGNREQGHTDYYTAISRIRAYLEKNMTYSTATDPFTDSGDFVTNFLTESKIGHSVHYATAATLMFRYYGIPSRYVEGYLITPEDVRDKTAGDSIEIPGKNGHAWTEIYMDGLGWVPIEMTPEYYGVMEEPDLTLGLEAQGSRTAPLPEVQDHTEELPDIQTHWNLKLALAGLTRFLVLLLLVIDVFCILFFMIVCGLRVYANFRRKKAFASKDSRVAVRALTGYAVQLYHHGDYGPELSDRYQTAYRTGEKAAFSRHEISEKERKDVEQCVAQMITELKAKTGWYDLWIMKYIERLL
ncbi:DUF3488 and transglutaminase-like domain-containing protein [Blautia sp. MSJ-19]|uniref:DUF3488 and transglutaminase-like domain-containing protein n=1 Tax=Blautia sp. MSJ-19 TaxID=2841517 RepID=UPI001C0EACC1|nr:transglutaminase domain-containing protein [Blautia sp. MSJ-19]MBU5479724.1 DUF3488 and transglutaminase-like domain-containing protein [Blautia sp. MSJ-19]